jgi:hypothetical protein
MPHGEYFTMGCTKLLSGYLQKGYSRDQNIFPHSYKGGIMESIIP